MFTILIPVRDQEEALLRTLAALAPAAASGLVADVIVADHGSRDATLAVADAAGCTLVADCADRSAAISRGAMQARKAWILRLEAGDTPGEAVLAAAREHAGRAGAEPAAFLIRANGANPVGRVVAGWSFALCGWSRPADRRVLAPRAQARRLQDSERRWSGARLKPRIGRA